MENILVVNNDVDTMDLLKNWLEKKAYRVDYTSNKSAVPEMIREFQPSLIIVDILQKELLPDLKKNKDSCDVPVLLMTGYTRPYNSREGLVDDVIEKPFNLNLLQHKIETLIYH
jgi:DNA-binding response OmpR family regulator